VGQSRKYLEKTFNNLNYDIFSLERKSKIKFWKIKTFGLIDEVKSCFESSEFED